MDAVHVVPFDPARHADSAVALLGTVFGDAVMHREALARYAGQADAVLLVATRPGAAPTEVLGLSLAVLAGPAAHARYRELFGIDVAARFGAGPLGQLNILAVHPGARRAGIGWQLAHALGAWLRARGCQGSVGVCWDHRGDDTSRHLFERAGFTLLGRSTTYYRDLHGNRCPRCGATCRCAALLYGASLPCRARP